MARMSEHMTVWIAPPHPLTGRLKQLDHARSCFHDEYAALLDSDQRMRGCVLDVGCGGDYPGPTALRAVLRRCDQLDGVEPRDIVHDHPGLMNRWHGMLETSDITPDTYDAVFTFWVVEHIDDPVSFFAAAQRVLKPGGCCYALTGSALHPFALATRTVQALRLKQRVRRASTTKINEYPAHYRANRIRTIVRSARTAGFERADFWRIPCRQWDTFMPRRLRFIASAYDYAIGARLPAAAQILMYRLTKPGEWKSA